MKNFITFILLVVVAFFLYHGRHLLAQAADNIRDYIVWSGGYRKGKAEAKTYQKENKRLEKENATLRRDLEKSKKQQGK